MIGRARMLPSHALRIPRLLLVTALAAAASPVAAQDIPLPGALGGSDSGGGGGPRLGLSGYLEDTLFVERLRALDTTATLNTLRLRLNLAARLTRDIDANATLIGAQNSGDRAFDLTGYLPPGQRAVISPELRPAFHHALDAGDTYVQEAFLTYRHHGLTVRAGRHKLYSGTGYAFNPIDLFNTKDPLDPTYEVDGLDAVLISVQLGASSEIEGVVRFRNRRQSTDEQLRYRTHVNGWDLALQATRHGRTRTDFAALAAGEVTASPLRTFEWTLLGGELAGELCGVGLHGEGGWATVEAPPTAGSLADAARDHLRLLVGADYTFTSQLYVIVEYMYLGQGRTDPGEITLNDRLAYYGGEILAINRDTVFAGVSYPATDLIDVSLYAIVDANTPSVVLNPWLVRNLRPGLVLSASAALPAGDRDGPNGEAGASGFVRLRYSF